MSFDWKEYFNLADELSKGETEAKLRSSISRAYYAVFNTAKQIIEQKDPYVKIPRNNSHKWLIGYFKESSFHYHLSQNIEELRDLRNDADYDSSSISSQEAEQSLELAKLIIKNLEN